MTDRPIIFSAPMIRALLDGRKNQHRFPMTTANTLFDGRPWRKLQTTLNWGWDRAWVDKGPSPAGNPGPYLKLPSADDETVHRIYPKTQPGDHFWVKEAWADLRNDPHCDLSRRLGDGPAYRATDDDEMTIPPRWRSPTHMPRWASRLTLTITDVRVQRLADITLGDCWAEGCETARDLIDTGFIPQGHALPFSEFRQMWGDEAWLANPWVCAITFDVRRGNIDMPGLAND